jgi:hypothetical protein
MSCCSDFYRRLIFLLNYALTLNFLDRKFSRADEFHLLDLRTAKISAGHGFRACRQSAAIVKVPKVQKAVKGNSKNPH